MPSLSSVHALLVADPDLNPEPLLAKLRELCQQQPDLAAGIEEVREALAALTAKTEAAKAIERTPKIVEAMLAAAVQGVANAQCLLGTMHHSGQGGPKDCAEARQLLGLAAAQGRADAQYLLGLMHHSGGGGPKDSAEARRLLGLAAAQGDADAQCLLGTMHHSGQGGPKDYAEARRLLGLAAAQGRAEAQCTLGRMHHWGRGGPIYTPHHTGEQTFHRANLKG